MDQISTVTAFSGGIILMKHYFFMVMPEMIRVVVMSKLLAVVTEELIKTL